MDSLTELQLFVELLGPPTEPVVEMVKLLKLVAWKAQFWQQLVQLVDSSRVEDEWWSSVTSASSVIDCRATLVLQWFSFEDEDVPVLAESIALCAAGIMTTLAVEQISWVVRSVIEIDVIAVAAAVVVVVEWDSVSSDASETAF